MIRKMAQEHVKKTVFNKGHPVTKVQCALFKMILVYVDTFNKCDL